ncbi:MAG: hypothetical protein IJP86_09595 [Synergistaceae bacterium]|nr:hypothetical protein [Synergistaceae bacterium]
MRNIFTRVTPKKLLLALLIAGVCWLVQLAIQDSSLDIDLLRESLLNMPGIVMENIRFSREISGDLWQVRLPYLEQRDKTVNFRSADIKRTLSGDKGQWSFFGKAGVYSDDKKAASLYGLTGTLHDEGRTWTLDSPVLTWQETGNTLIFPQGLTLRDDEFSLDTPIASTDNSRVILLQHGGVIIWRKPKSSAR